MIDRSPIIRNKRYYEALGEVKATLNHVDFYRLKRVKQQLRGTSVLDVGCGKADFLKLIEDSYQIDGVEVNQKRVSYCNQVLGQDAVRLGNLSRKLVFKSNSFDTVTCLEVLEHLDDPARALKELVRLSRKRVIITVPFNEQIQYVLCVHCARYTSVSGHLHSFNKENINSIIPDTITNIKIELIGSRALTYSLGLTHLFRLPIPIISFIDNISNRIIPKARWMMVILDKR